MKNFRRTLQLVAVFIFIGTIQLSAQTYKYQKTLQ